MRIAGVQFSPDGSLLAYLRTDPGGEEMELWVYPVPGGPARRLLRPADLGGAEGRIPDEERMVRERLRRTEEGITSFAWTDEGTGLLIPWGGGVWLYEMAGGRLARLLSQADAFDPRLSPGGRYLSFVAGGEIRVLDRGTSGIRTLTSGAAPGITNGISEFVAQEEMGRTSGYWWSPDGTRIAFLRVDNRGVEEFRIPRFLEEGTAVVPQPYPRAGSPNAEVRVGVVGVGGGGVSWLETASGEDAYIARVSWHPAGERVMVQVQNRRQDTLRLWSMDPGGKDRTLLLTETDPRWVTLHDSFQWIEDGRRFLWASERTGFRHIYCADPDGAGLRPVTAGEWEVHGLAGVDETAGRVYFSAGDPSALERRLCWAPLAGGDPRPVTVEPGWHDCILAPGARWAADLHSTADSPPSLHLVAIPEGTRTEVEPNADPPVWLSGLPRMEFLRVPGGGGTALNAFLIRPPEFDSARRYPLLLYVYGGPTVQIVLNQWGSAGGSARTLWLRMAATQGILVAGVDNRGTPGRGRAFQEGVRGSLGRVELEDQLAAVEYFRSLSCVDSSRIMIWGKSYGGTMTLAALFRAPGVFRAGMALAPVTDWRNYDTHYTERYLGLPSENPEGYRESSPMTHAGGLAAGLLLVHGMADDNVHFRDSVLLADALQRAGKQFRFMAYPRSTHAFAGEETGAHLYAMLLEYVKEHLLEANGGGTPAPLTAGAPHDVRTDPADAPADT
ncbi:MAG: DPP IV N-terminal domain-containing protein [Bacteroidota bacterium]